MISILMVPSLPLSALSLLHMSCIRLRLPFLIFTVLLSGIPFSSWIFQIFRGAQVPSASKACSAFSVRLSRFISSVYCTTASSPSLLFGSIPPRAGAVEMGCFLCPLEYRGEDNYIWSVWIHWVHWFGNAHNPGRSRVSAKPVCSFALYLKYNRPSATFTP